MRRLLIAVCALLCGPAMALGFSGTARSTGNAAGAAEVFRPVGVTPPTVAGVLRSGETLTATPGDWSRQPDSYAYRWERCDDPGCVPVGRDTAYTLTDADVRHSIRVVVSAVNAGGSSTQVSADSAPVDDRLRLATSTSPPRLSGLAEQGATLTATVGTWSGATGHTVRWQRCDAGCADIDGETQWTYRLRAADADRRVRAVVTATGEGGTTSAASEPTGTVKSQATMYREAVLEDRPALYWPLDGGAATDTSGHGRDGQLLGGTVGQAGAMTGSQGSIAPRAQRVGEVLASGANHTLEAWIRRGTANLTEAVGVVGDTRDGFGLLVGDATMWSTGPCLWQVAFGAGRLRADPCALATARWHHVAVTTHDGVSRLYVDGVQAGGPASTGAGAPAARFTVGFASGAGGASVQHPWRGAIDDVAVYTTALPATRIRAHFERGSQGG